MNKHTHIRSVYKYTYVYTHTHTQTPTGGFLGKRKRDKERGVAVGVTGAGNGGLQTAELSLDSGAVMVEQPPSFEPKAPPARSKVASMSFNRARSAVSSSSSRGKERAMAPAASVIGSDFVVIDE